LPPTSQQPYRAGFADPLIAKADSNPYTANAARPLLNSTMGQKLTGLALTPDHAANLDSALQRSNTMFQTRAKALGGSATVENMNDQHAAGVDPQVLWDAATEGIPGLIKGAVRVGSNFLGGSTPNVRAELAKLLLQSGPNADVMGSLGPAVAAQARRAAMARALMGAGIGGVATGVPALSGGYNGRPSQ
jgi:hypothetical protein